MRIESQGDQNRCAARKRKRATIVTILSIDALGAILAGGMNPVSNNANQRRLAILGHQGLRSLRAFFPQSSCFASTIAQIVQLGATCMCVSQDLDLFDAR
jgi:hypothetical protein